MIDGFSRDIDGCEAIGYPVYGRGVTMISARNRVVRLDAGMTLSVAGVKASEDDGVVIVPQRKG